MNWYTALIASNDPTALSLMISFTVRVPLTAPITSLSMRVSFSVPRESSAN